MEWIRLMYLYPLHVTDALIELFAAGGIRYSEQDIEKSSSAAEGHRRLGGNGVPLIVVGDEIIHGYDEARLRRLLRHWLKRG